MHKDRPAFGQRLAELAELGVIEFRPEPLDAIVERRLKTIWEECSFRTVAQTVSTPSPAPTASDVVAVTGK